jgi:signal transduction histidine kinase
LLAGLALAPVAAALSRERTFVADASHELRTPLSVLRTELELAERHERSAEELRGALHSASEEADRLSRLAEDLLVLARSDEGTLPIKREPVKLGDLLERVRARFSGRAGEVGREITVEAQPNMRADLDPMRVEQALGNLVDNALRHGEGEIHLGAATDDGHVVFEVSDEGAGLPRAYTPKAFERFTRADEGRTGGGSGLGLAIVQAIATAHDGHAEIADVGGPRATVRISVPLRVSAPSES